jgi:hypothetical protein
MFPIVSENIYQSFTPFLETVFNFPTCLTLVSGIAKIVVVFDYVR